MILTLLHRQTHFYFPKLHLAISMAGLPISLLQKKIGSNISGLANDNGTSMMSPLVLTILPGMWYFSYIKRVIYDNVKILLILPNSLIFSDLHFKWNRRVHRPKFGEIVSS